jgi:hypothetical protein
MQELFNDAAKAGNLPDLLRFVDSYALPTLVPSFSFVCVAVRLHARLFTLAVFTPAFSRSPLLHSCWAAPAAGGIPVLTEYASTRPNPFLVGISGGLKNEPSAAAPRDPQPYLMDWDGLLRVPNARGIR